MLFMSSLLVQLACTQSKDTGSGVLPPGDEPSITLHAPHLRRLNSVQYNNVVGEIFGDGLVIPTALEPDVEASGLLSIGASLTSISPVGTERYENAAYTISLQVIEDEDRLSAYHSCNSIDDFDDTCSTELVTNLGRHLWRRPLTSAEVDRTTGLLTTIASESGSTATGVEFAIAALLQSPHFLYRTEHGDAQGVLTDFELASRLSFLLWNTTPDAQLLDIAEQGTLKDPTTLENEVDRMMNDDRFQQGIDNFFTEVLTLYHVEDMVKDPFIFTHASPELAASAKEETLLSIGRIVNLDLDFRDVLTTQTTYVDRRLAALYNIQAPSPDGFSEVILPPSSGRRGLLGQASTLGLHAHATSSSATLRGVFIRRTLLCQVIPPPPSDVDTSIPEADAESPTLRERIHSHLEDPSCSGCHELMDLVGLGLENFDGIGRWRSTENGATIDPSGEIDGDSFGTAWDMAEVVRNHENLDHCFSKHLYQYAVGHELSDEEEAVHDWLTDHFAYSGWSFRSLMHTIALSNTFQTVGALQ